jgi:hypothetical protein
LDLNTLRLMGSIMEPVPPFPTLDGTKVKAMRMEEDDWPVYDFLGESELIWPSGAKIFIRFDDSAIPIKKLYTQCVQLWTKHTPSIEVIIEEARNGDPI